MPASAIERVVCVVRRGGRYKNYCVEMKIDGTFVVRSHIKKDLYEYLHDKGVPTSTEKAK